MSNPPTNMLGPQSEEEHHRLNEAIRTAAAFNQALIGAVEHGPGTYDIAIKVIEGDDGETNIGFVLTRTSE